MNARRALFAVAMAAPFALLVAVGCNAILGNEPKELAPPTPDAPIDAQDVTEVTPETIAETPPDTAGCDGPLPDTGPLCPGKRLYVSSKGDDRNTGCDPCAPKATLAAAIAALEPYAVSDGGVDASGDADARPPTPLDGFEISVCKGEYPEAKLRLAVPVSIKGGYDCGTWKRTAKYGYPDFDRVNDTIISNALPSSEPDTFVIDGDAVGRSAVVDGLHLLGASKGVGSSSAITVSGNASPTLSNLDIEGGEVSGGTGRAASTGLTVTSGAPEVIACRIRGGKGSGPNNGSIGAQLGGPTHIKGSRVEGGAGISTTGYYGSVGLYVTAAAPMTIEESIIDGGTGNGVLGLYMTDFTDVELLHCDVHSGVASALGQIDTAVVVSNGTLTAKRNRLWADKQTVAGSGTIAVHAITASLYMVNNLIHGGQADATNGIVLDAPYEGLIAFNTIHGGSSTVTADTIQIGAGAKGSPFKIYSNLLLGNGSSGSRGLHMTGSGCNSACTLDLFRANAMISVASLMYTDTPCTGTPALSATMSAVQTDLRTCSSGTVVENFAIAGTCGDAQCLAVPECDAGDAGIDTTKCLGALFASWSKGDDGLASMLEPTPAWQLKPSDSCVLTKGAFLGSLATYGKDDYLGAKRDSNFSMGAIQVTATGCKP